LEAKALHTKTVAALFHLNNKETERELKVNFNNETLPFCSEPKYLRVGQVAHLSPTPSVTSQEADITRRDLEVACWLRLGCWSNNFANSYHSPGAFNRRVAYSAPVWFRSAHSRPVASF